MATQRHNTHVPLGDETELFLQALAEAYHQMAMLAPIFTIGDMNAAPHLADRAGEATPHDYAVRNTIKKLGLVDLTADLEGQPSQFPHQTEAAPSRIDVCYCDPTTIIRAEARYNPLQLQRTGHGPLHIRLTIPNHAQRRQLEKRPFTIHEVRKAIHSLWQHKTPGYHDLPAEAYHHLPAHLLHILANRLLDIVTGQTALPTDRRTAVHPLHKKEDCANKDNLRPIVCAVTEVKIVWTILLRRIFPHLDPHIPADLWGAIPGRSPHEAIFLKDTIAEMDPVDLMIASLDVKRAFPNTPRLLLEAVWKHMGLPFYKFTSNYIRTREYTERASLPSWSQAAGSPREERKGPSCTSL